MWSSEGAGPALLLVHGFGASTYDYEQHVLGPLAETHRVVAVDLFGMGLSERREDFSYDFAGWADQLAATLEALGIERAIVAGHSMGGAVASLLAARHSDQVAGLVLIGALYPSWLSETPWVFLVLRTPGLGELAIGSLANLAPPGAPPDYRARMAAISRIAGSRAALIRYIRSPGKFEALEAAYPSVRAPTLILHGGADASVAHAAMLRAAPKLDRRARGHARGQGALPALGGARARRRGDHGLLRGPARGVNPARGAPKRPGCAPGSGRPAGPWPSRPW